jgi:hypothetical protein
LPEPVKLLIFLLGILISLLCVAHFLPFATISHGRERRGCTGGLRVFGVLADVLRARLSRANSERKESEAKVGRSGVDGCLVRAAEERGGLEFLLL